MAGALGVRLGGPAAYFGQPADKPWLGDGAAPGPEQVRSAFALLHAASALLVAAAALILAAAGAGLGGLLGVVA
jgi:adenosylcobinamide-phosphate synthase